MNLEFKDEHKGNIWGGFGSHTNIVMNESTPDDTREFMYKNGCKHLFKESDRDVEVKTDKKSDSSNDYNSMKKSELQKLFYESTGFEPEKMTKADLVSELESFDEGKYLQ